MNTYCCVLYVEIKISRNNKNTVFVLLQMWELMGHPEANDEPVKQGPGTLV